MSPNLLLQFPAKCELLNWAGCLCTGARAIKTTNKIMNASLVPLIRKTGFRYGIMLGALSSALFLTFAFLKPSASLIPMLPELAFAIALIYLAHLYFKENNNGTMTFGQGVTISFWMGLSSGILAPLVTYVYSKFINTTYMLDAARVEMGKKGLGLPDEQIDTVLNALAVFMSPEVTFFLGILSYLISAVIIGLVVSLFTKKDPPATF